MKTKNKIEIKDKIKEYFKKLRFDEKHHLGLGDIRLTIAQQDKIIDMVKDASKIIKKNKIERKQIKREKIKKEFGIFCYENRIGNEKERLWKLICDAAGWEYQNEDKD